MGATLNIFSSTDFFNFLLCDIYLLSLKCHYDENHIFPIEAISKQISSLYEKKNAVYYFQISLFIPEIFKFLKYAN